MQLRMGARPSAGLVEGWRPEEDDGVGRGTFGWGRFPSATAHWAVACTVPAVASAHVARVPDARQATCLLAAGARRGLA